MKILFSTGSSVLSTIVKWASWSRWSHVEILINGQAFGSTFPKGVGSIPYSERLERATEVCIMNTPTINRSWEAEAQEWALSQKGKPYDTLGALGLGLHHCWQDDSAWWCSELVGAAMLIERTLPYRPEIIKRLFPENLFMLDYPVEWIKGEPGYE